MGVPRRAAQHERQPAPGCAGCACAAQENSTSALCAVPSASLAVITREDVAHDPPSSS